MATLERRSLLKAGGGAVVGASLLSLVPTTAQADTVLTTNGNPAGASNLPTLLWSSAKGWPTRPVATPVVWVDEFGGAPKPPLKTGDLYMKAHTAAATSSQLLTSSQAFFTGGWQLENGAYLKQGTAVLPNSNSDILIDQFPAHAGKTLTFKVQVNSGNATLVMQGFDPSKSYPGVWTANATGTPTISQVVPAGATQMAVWVRYGSTPSVISNASLLEG